MNALPTPENKNAIELAKKFLAENKDTFEFAGIQENWAIASIAELVLRVWTQGGRRQATRNWVESGNNFTEWLEPVDFDMTDLNTETLPDGEKV